MAKKQSKKKARSAPRLLKWLTLLFAFGLVFWLGFGFYQDYKLDHATPMDEVVHNEPSIGDIIAPIVEQPTKPATEETFTLVFEDKLPEPIRRQENKPSVHADRHQIALIIDDVGYDMKALRRLLALPFPLTVSILPDAPYAKQTAQAAFQHGVPVMLHMPMQTSNPKYTNKMEDFYLYSAMSKSVFTQVFEDALAKVPHAIGVNNHMGSALTADKRSMQWLMELCAKHGLFFIDSRTSSASVAAKTAEKQGIAWNSRDIFLDNSVATKALNHTWQSALSCANKYDTCVMLAHPHQETISFLEESIKSKFYPRFIPIESALR